MLPGNTALFSLKDIEFVFSLKIVPQYCLLACNLFKQNRICYDPSPTPAKFFKSHPERLQSASSWQAAGDHRKPIGFCKARPLQHHPIGMDFLFWTNGLHSGGTSWVTEYLGSLSNWFSAELRTSGFRKSSLGSKPCAPLRRNAYQLIKVAIVLKGRTTPTALPSYPGLHFWLRE